VDVEVRQGSALLPVLYLSFIFHILEKILKNLKIPVSFVDNNVFVS